MMDFQKRLEALSPPKRRLLARRLGLLAENHSPQDSAEQATQSLVAYVAPAGQTAPSAGDLREFLRQTLPDYMIPNDILFLDGLPRTPNGKIDRRALPAPDSPDDTARQTHPPRTETEHRLWEIWQALLGRRDFGRDDDFFRLGGHSLLVTQLVAQIRQDFALSLPLTRVFEAPTLAGLAQHIDALAWASQQSPPTPADDDDDEREVFEF